MKIIVVDDKRSMRSAMAKILVSLGFEDITMAEDGREGWEMIRQAFGDKETAGFDLIVSDMEMPRMSGLELLESVRSTPGLDRTPFIMATTVSEKQIILKTMRLGVSAYILKPFDPPMVEFKLRQAGIL
mgnify:CR=1 FL=1